MSDTSNSVTRNGGPKHVSFSRGAGIRRHGRVVLVVEDDFDTQQMMRIILRKEYHVLLASNTAEAMKMIETCRVDVVLMDMSLGEKDSGLDATRMIRTRWSMDQLPVIALTACASRAQGMQFLEAGGTDYMTKPFQVAALRECMHRHTCEKTAAESSTC